jgi:hypothetical protein
MQVRNRNSEEYNVLKIQLEGIIEELERHFEQVRRLVATLALCSATNPQLCSHQLIAIAHGAAGPREVQYVTAASMAAVLAYWRAVFCATGQCCVGDVAFMQAHKVYLEGTEHRTSAFNKLTQGDAGAARVIEQRMKKLIKLQVCSLRLPMA